MPFMSSCFNLTTECKQFREELFAITSVVIQCRHYFPFVADLCQCMGLGAIITKLWRGLWVVAHYPLQFVSPICCIGNVCFGQQHLAHLEVYFLFL